MLAEICYNKPIEEERTQLETEADGSVKQQLRTELVGQASFVRWLSQTIAVGFLLLSGHELPQRSLPLATVDETTTRFAQVRHECPLREKLEAPTYPLGL